MGLMKSVLKGVLLGAEAFEEKPKIKKDYTEQELKDLINAYLCSEPFSYNKKDDYNRKFVIGMRYIDYTSERGGRYSFGKSLELFFNDGQKTVLNQSDIGNHDSLECLCEGLTLFIPRFANEHIYDGPFSFDEKKLEFDKNYFDSFVKVDELDDLSEIELTSLKIISADWINNTILLNRIGSAGYNKWKKKMEAINARIQELFPEDEDINEKYESSVLYSNELFDSGDFISDKEAKEQAGEKGERDVAYALSWLSEECIVLNSIDKQLRIYNEEFNREAQEIDHIVITHCGVFLIETKALSGHIVIDENGNWRREKNGEWKGIANPSQQVKRHEKLVKSILPKTIKIYSIICIANEKAIIDGIDNSQIPVVKSDMLTDYIENILESDARCIEDLNTIVNIFEKYLI